MDWRSRVKRIVMLAGIIGAAMLGVWGVGEAALYGVPSDFMGLWASVILAAAALLSVPIAISVRGRSDVTAAPWRAPLPWLLWALIMAMPAVILLIDEYLPPPLYLISYRPWTILTAAWVAFAASLLDRSLRRRLCFAIAIWITAPFLENLPLAMNPMGLYYPSYMAVIFGLSSAAAVGVHLRYRPDQPLLHRLAKRVLGTTVCGALGLASGVCGFLVGDTFCSAVRGYTACGLVSTEGQLALLFGWYAAIALIIFADVCVLITRGENGDRGAVEKPVGAKALMGRSVFSGQ